MGTFSLGNTRIESGGLVLSVAPDAVLVVDDRAGQVETELTRALMAAVASGDRATILAALRESVASFPSAAVVVLGDGRGSAFVYGELAVAVESAGSRIEVTSASGAIDEVPLPSTLRSIAVLADGVDPIEAGGGEGVDSTAARVAQVRFDLVQVALPPEPPGDSGLGPEAAKTVHDQGAAPAVREFVAAPVAPVLSTGDAPAGPQVLGVRCPRGHHNHPDALYCASCGLKLAVNQTLVAELGPRPPLGVLVLDDGATVTIDADLVVGREPQFHDLVTAGLARDVVVPDTELNLSREHFALRLDGWDVAVDDLGSANGTLVLRDGTSEWELIRPGSPRQLGSGDRVAGGTRVFQIQLHHIAQ